MPSLLSPDHNSDLRDSHECLEKQVWVAWILTRQSSRRRLGLERTKLTAVSVTVCFNSAHPTYILKRLGYTKMSLKSELCDTRDTCHKSPVASLSHAVSPVLCPDQGLLREDRERALFQLTLPYKIN